MSDLLDHVANKIRTLRLAAGLKQADLAKKLEVTPNTISRWESGLYKPKMEDIEKLSRALGEPIWAFFPGDVAPPSEAQRALLSATGDLPQEDLEELIRYVEFVRARKKVRESGPSRPRKKRVESQ